VVKARYTREEAFTSIRNFFASEQYSILTVSASDLIAYSMNLTAKEMGNTHFLVDHSDCGDLNERIRPLITKLVVANAGVHFLTMFASGTISFRSIPYDVMYRFYNTSLVTGQTGKFGYSVAPSNYKAGFKMPVTVDEYEDVLLDSCAPAQPLAPTKAKSSTSVVGLIDELEAKHACLGATVSKLKATIG